MQSYLKQVRKLQQKKYRTTADHFVAEGTTLILDLLKDKHPIEVLFCTPSFHERHCNLFPEQLKIFILNADQLKRLGSLKSNRGALALCPKPKLKELPLCANYLVFEDIQNPNNLGAILRAACWYGFEALICSPQSVDIYNPKTLTASMGAFTKIQIHYTDLPNFIGDRKQTHHIIGTFPNGKNLHKHRFKSKNIVVFGNETRGISPQLSKYLDLKLTIPRYGPMESLNLALAMAIFCDHLKR